jgi:hypothetical protein
MPAVRVLAINWSLPDARRVGHIAFAQMRGRGCHLRQTPGITLTSIWAVIEGAGRRVCEASPLEKQSEQPVYAIDVKA